MNAAMQYELVRWEYRWLNPTGQPLPDSVLEWQAIVPRWNQTIKQACDELIAYRFEGKQIYHIRALYTTGIAY
jgi:hypothetical protein